MADSEEAEIQLDGSTEAEVEGQFDGFLANIAQVLRDVARRFPRRAHMRDMHPRHSRTIEWPDWPHPVVVIFTREEMGVDQRDRWHLIVAYERTAKPVAREIAHRVAGAFFPEGETTEAHIPGQPALHYLQDVLLREPAAQA